jgi:hypothetical protein
MTGFAVATHTALLILRSGSEGALEIHLEGRNPECVAVDPMDHRRLYAGTRGDGLWRSADGGRTWEPAGEGLPHPEVTAVAVQGEGGSGLGTVYVGTEPSTLSRSRESGERWEEMTGLQELPSASRWSFPPKPDTHHVRWIEADPHEVGRLYVAIEAGALVRTVDGGETWIDRVPGGPIDTHSAATHPDAPGRLYSAAGDGYFESQDGGDTWSRPMDGLRHRYLVGVAVDRGDPDTVVVSAASGPHVAYSPRRAEAYVYRRSAGGPFELAMAGLPEGRGTVASRLASDPDEAGLFYAANNHGLFRSLDGGRSWEALGVRWPQGIFDRGVAALAAFKE